MSVNDSGTRSAAAVQASGGGSVEPPVGIDVAARLRSLETPWLWSFAGALLVWLVIAGVFGFSIAGNVVVTALVFAVFMVLVGLGQMIVITAGPGNIDLSMPSAIALSGVLGVQLMQGRDDLIVLGVAVALAVGVLVGLANYVLIRVLRIPPIIATLSSSFIVQSIAITQSRSMPAPPHALQAFANARLAGVPDIAWLALASSLVLAFVLHRTVFGRALSALGQNARAAWLAGVQTERVRWVTYVLAAIIAALTGLLLAAVSGGAALDMGVEYMLISVAVVVIGGTQVAGGKATVAGVWGASLFLYLTNAMLNALGAGAGIRSIVYGVLIIAVVVASGRKARQ
ncbi:MAG: ABC transporter permease [Burkholderiales bacterium]|nr:ABC transporter permease [Burkholderiales bacterium]